MTQKEMIKQHLLQFGSITSWEAIKEYGATRLSHLIYVLRKENMNINKTIIKTKNRFGNNTHYAMYYLEKENENE